MKIPVVVTTTTEKMWEPVIPGLAEALQSVPKIERTTVNAWTEKRVVDAVKSTGRKQLIVTGISTDVCLAFLAISALADGYGTFGVINASGAFTKMQGMLGMMRMMQAGVVPVAYSNVAVEIWPIMRHPRTKRYTVPSACHLSAWSKVSTVFLPLVSIPTCSGEGREARIRFAVLHCDDQSRIRQESAGHGLAGGSLQHDIEANNEKGQPCWNTSRSTV
jgi:hypothetical protein